MPRKNMSAPQKKRKGKKYITKHVDIAEYMGVDWGKSDVGIALADGETRLSHAYTTLHNDNTLLDELRKIIAEKGVHTVILGIPSPINRAEVSYESERLGELIEHNLGVVVHYQNEMFSTKLAQTKLIEKGIKGVARFDDQEAARIILQDWLDRETLKNK